MANGAVDLDGGVVEVDEHDAVGDHALAPDRDVLVGGDRALLSEHGLGADRDDPLVTAQLRPMPEPRPAPELDSPAAPNVEVPPGADEPHPGERETPPRRRQPSPSPEPEQQARVAEGEHPV